jgi:hypothetical protein
MEKNARTEMLQLTIVQPYTVRGVQEEVFAMGMVDAAQVEMAMVYALVKMGTQAANVRYLMAAVPEEV